MLCQAWFAMGTLGAGRAPATTTAGGCTSMQGWPDGFYTLAEMWSSHIVVVSELPKTPDTLALRLMGKGQVLEEAMQKVRARRQESFVWEEIARHIVDVSHQSEPSWSDDRYWEEFVMHTQKMMRQIEEEARKEGRKEGRQEGREEGRQEGLRAIVRLFSGRLSRALTVRETSHLQARLTRLGSDALLDITDGLDTAALETWLNDATQSIRNPIE